MGGGDGNAFFFTAMKDYNTKLGIESVTALARICEEHKENCAGVELLNEPCCAWNGASDVMIDRNHLLDNFYKPAIKKIRGDEILDSKIPLVIQDWTPHRHFWIRKAKELGSSYFHKNNVLFSTHLYARNNDLDQIKPAWHGQFWAFAWWQSKLKKQKTNLLLTEFEGLGTPNSQAHQQLLEAVQRVTSGNGGKGNNPPEHDDSAHDDSEPEYMLHTTEENRPGPAPGPSEGSGSLSTCCWAVIIAGSVLAVCGVLAVLLVLATDRDGDEDGADEKKTPKKSFKTSRMTGTFREPLDGGSESAPTTEDRTDSGEASGINSLQ
eukprot:g5875.t1